MGLAHSQFLCGDVGLCASAGIATTNVYEKNRYTKFNSLKNVSYS